METYVVVNVSCVVPITCGKEAVQSFVEKLAKDVVSDIIHNADENIDITTINAIAPDNVICG